MLLLSDSGSTKTHWLLMTANGHAQDFYTEGINPVLQSPDEIQTVIDQLLTQIGSLLWAGTVTHVFFYGAGCIPEKQPLVRDLLAQPFKHAHIEVASDMLGAARGLCQREQGIACILGTGSGSCFYDGQQIAATVPSLGYILGDEGSGATLGKRLVSDVLKNQLPSELKEALLREYNLMQADILDRVYHQPMPNRFLAELSQFCARHLANPAIRQLVYDHFDAFVKRNILQYLPTETANVGTTLQGASIEVRRDSCVPADGSVGVGGATQGASVSEDLLSKRTENPAVSFTGSIAFYYKEVLERVLADNHLTLGTIMKDPIEGLKQYHQPDLIPTQL